MSETQGLNEIHFSPAFVAPRCSMRRISIFAPEQTETPSHRFSGQEPNSARTELLSAASRWLRFVNT